MTGVPPPTPPNTGQAALVQSVQNLINTLNTNNTSVNNNTNQAAAWTRSSASLEAQVANLTSSFRNFTSPLVRLQDSIRRMDQTNRKALTMGTTTQKLQESVSKNSNILDKGLVSNQKLTDAILNNFEAGVRTQTESLMDLTQEMVATGQSTESLTKMSSDLVLFTGNNTAAIEKVSKVNKEVSDKYGVSNQKLIESVNSLRDTFEMASFFGPKTTASLEALSKEIKGRAGGANVEGAMNTLMKLLTPDMSTIAAGQLLGAQGARARAGEGEALSMSDIQPILDNVTRIYEQTAGTDPNARLMQAATQSQISEQQFVQLKQLADLFKNNYELNAEMKKTDDETLNSLQNINERAKNFYDKTAVGMLAVLGSISTNTMMMVQNAAMAGGGAASLFGGGAAGKLGKLSRGLGIAGIAGMMFQDPINNAVQESTGFDMGNTLSYAGMGATIGSVIPVLGTGIGAAAGGAIGLFMAIKDNTESSAKADQERIKMEREKRNRERAEAATEEIRRAQFMIQYLRSRGGIKLDEGNLILKELLEQMRRNGRDAERRRTERPE